MDGEITMQLGRTLLVGLLENPMSCSWVAQTSTWKLQSQSCLAVSPLDWIKQRKKIRNERHFASTIIISQKLMLILNLQLNLLFWGSIFKEEDANQTSNWAA